MQSDFSRLELIKQQILIKLGLTEKPHVTHPKSKQFVWDTLYHADGVISVDDLNFNHPLQEHMSLKITGVLTPPSFFSSKKSNHLIFDSKYKKPLNESNNDKIRMNHDSIGALWKLSNFTYKQSRTKKKSFRRKVKRLQNKKNLRSRLLASDYRGGDDFFGSTQEIITFAEKGKIYKKHRLVDFNLPSNKISTQKLKVRNADIHIRIEKVSPISEKTIINQCNHSYNRKTTRLGTSREPDLKIWVFQVIGADFLRKGFDQATRLSTTFSVDRNVLGWQKIDITETVQFWYGKQKNQKLRLLIDCTGCGNKYLLNLFDRRYHNSLFPSIQFKRTKPAYLFQTLNVTIKPQYYKFYNAVYFDSKNNNDCFHSIYNHSRNVHTSYIQKCMNIEPTNSMLQRSKNFKPIKLMRQTKIIHHLQLLWFQNRIYRKYREIKNSITIKPDQYHSKPENKYEEDLSYKVAAAKFHLQERLNPNTPFLVFYTESPRARRVRRRAVDCSSAISGQCCKESFYVSFKALGWDDWIIAPRGYFANYCRGDCTGPFRTPDTFQTFHTHFIEEYRKMGLLNGMQPCCAPIIFSSMSLIYYGDDGIIKRDLPKMVVDECGCP